MKIGLAGYGAALLGMVGYRVYDMTWGALVAAVAGAAAWSAMRWMAAG